MAARPVEPRSLALVPYLEFERRMAVAGRARTPRLPMTAAPGAPRAQHCCADSPDRYGRDHRDHDRDESDYDRGSSSRRARVMVCEAFVRDAGDDRERAASESLTDRQPEDQQQRAEHEPDDGREPEVQDDLQSDD